MSKQKQIIKKSVNEAWDVKDGNFRFLSKDGYVQVFYKGKEIATGDFDRGADGYFVNNKYFDDKEEVLQFYKNKYNESVNEISWAEMERIDTIQKDIKAHITKNYKDEIKQKKDRWMKSYSDLVGHSGKGLNKKNLKNIVKLAKQNNDKKLLQMVASLSKPTKKSVNEKYDSPMTIKVPAGEKLKIGSIIRAEDEQGKSILAKVVKHSGKGKRGTNHYIVEPIKGAAKTWKQLYGESVNEARMSSGNYSVMIGKTLDGFFGTLLVNTRGGKMGTATGIRYNNKSRDKVVKWAEKELKKVSKEPIVNESVNEDEQLDEKLITFSNRAPYGQVVFMAGGAGSGKGFAISNFIDSAGFKVRDVDEMKKQVGKLEKLGKISIDSWYKKFSGNLKPSEREHVETYVLNKGYTIADIANSKHKSGGLKNPNNVSSLHYIVDSMGIKNKWLVNMLSGKSNPETLPNLIFDITAKNIKSITKVIKPLLAQGYDPKNIHLIWVLTNYSISVTQNQERDRIVPADIQLLTHEGAAKTVWDIVSKYRPKEINGRIDVILGGKKNTVILKDKKGKPVKVQPNPYNKYDEPRIGVKGFKHLPVKKQGGGFYVERNWEKILMRWIKQNAPKTLMFKDDAIVLPDERKDSFSFDSDIVKTAMGK